MASITLEVQSAKLTSDFGDAGIGRHGKWVLTGTVKLPWRERLELGVMLRKHYDIRIESVTEDVRQHYPRVRRLARFPRSRRGAHA